MPSLHDIQHAFAAAIFERDASHVDGFLDSDGPNDSERRLAVYCNNVYDNLREALRAVYPVVESLVGGQFFRQAANRYIQDYASTSGDIQRFGSSFPSFLARFGPAASLSYLADTASLEWAMHVVFHEADHAPLALARLAQLSEADCSVLRFMLHPACRLMSSDFPVFKIWQANQRGAHADETVDARAGGELLLIRRDGFAIEVEPLRPGEFAMLEALHAGATVNDAYERALQADAAFGLAEFIRRRIGDATIVDFAAGPCREYGPACRSAS
jgi:hypothetical protein